MKKSPSTTRKPKKINSNEWDFRGVTEADLSAVLCYEYARSCDPLADAILRWQEAPFPGFPPALLEHLPAEARRRLSQLLAGTTFTDAIVMVRNTMGTIPRDLQIFLEEKMPPELTEFGANELAIKFEDFHKPWNSLPKSYRVEGRKELKICPLTPPVVEFLEMPELPAGYDRRLLGPSILLFDWFEYSDKQLLQYMKSWLPARRPSGEKGKSHTGKGSLPPFHMLKQLAAYRLNKMNYTHPLALEAIKTRKAIFEAKDPHDLLPTFTSGAWSTAIKTVSEFLAKKDFLRQIALKCHWTPWRTSDSG